MTSNSSTKNVSVRKQLDFSTLPVLTSEARKEVLTGHVPFVAILHQTLPGKFQLKKVYDSSSLMTKLNYFLQESAGNKTASERNQDEIFKKYCMSVIPSKFQERAYYVAYVKISSNLYYIEGSFQQFSTKLRLLAEFAKLRKEEDDNKIIVELVEEKQSSKRDSLPEIEPITWEDAS
jgi:hypothetical protein